MMVFFLIFMSLGLIVFYWQGFILMASAIFLMMAFFFPAFFDSLIMLGAYSNSFSFFMLYLSVFLLILMVNSSLLLYKKESGSLFSFIMLSLLFSLLLSFYVNSVLLFYFFFEVSLIPTLILITGWGFQVERVQASMYFLFYTMVSSLPLLLGLMMICSKNGSFMFYSSNIFLHMSKFMTFFPNLLFSWVFVGAFLVKLPLYSLHLWLPKAHVEAPVSGSMILAGVLLKLGGYGLVRFTPYMKGIFMKMSASLMSLSLMSMIYVGLICFRSNDLKSLIAYSSVSHMAMGLSGLISMMSYGLKGGVLMLIGHGVCSSGLFSLINLVYYRIGSRSMYMGKGLMSLIPSFGMFTFLLSISNMAAPPTMNLFSELLLMVSIVSYSNYTFVALLLGSFLVALYSIFFFSYVVQGKNNSLGFMMMSLNLAEYSIIYTHSKVMVVSFALINLVF